jgi:hypothetical protein
MNSVIDASAAASSTKTFNIFRLPSERNRNIVPLLFSGVKRHRRTAFETVADS